MNPAATYLVLINPEKIPHLGIVQNGKYFSLTYKKAQIGEDFKPYFNFLKKTGRRLLFIALEGKLNEIRDIFEQYDKAVVGKTTCLHPIREAVKPGSRANYIFELLPELEEDQLITGCYHTNMDDLLGEDESFELSTYDKDAIDQYIQTLNEKHAKRG